LAAALAASTPLATWNNDAGGRAGIQERRTDIEIVLVSRDNFLLMTPLPNHCPPTLLIAGFSIDHAT
jgi:hypothetical protein